MNILFILNSEDIPTSSFDQQIKIHLISILETQPKREILGTGKQKEKRKTATEGEKQRQKKKEEKKRQNVRNTKNEGGEEERGNGKEEVRRRARAGTEGTARRPRKSRLVMGNNFLHLSSAIHFRYKHQKSSSLVFYILYGN